MFITSYDKDCEKHQCGPVCTEYVYSINNQYSIFFMLIRLSDYISCLRLQRYHEKDLWNKYVKILIRTNDYIISTNIRFTYFKIEKIPSNVNDNHNFAMIAFTKFIGF